MWLRRWQRLPTTICSFKSPVWDSSQWLKDQEHWSRGNLHSSKERHLKFPCNLYQVQIMGGYNFLQWISMAIHSGDLHVWHGWAIFPQFLYSSPNFKKWNVFSHQGSFYDQRNLSTMTSITISRACILYNHQTHPISPPSLSPPITNPSPAYFPSFYLSLCPSSHSPIQASHGFSWESSQENLTWSKWVKEYIVCLNWLQYVCITWAWYGRVQPALREEKPWESYFSLSTHSLVSFSGNSWSVLHSWRLIHGFALLLHNW